MRTSPQPQKYAAMDIHGQDDIANLVEGNLIVEGNPGIIVGGGGSSHGNDGPWNVVRGNVIRDCKDGIGVFKKTHHTVIEENLIENPTRYGIRVGSGCTNSYLWNNRVTGSIERGIYLDRAENGEVIGNEVNPSGGEAMRIRDTQDYRVLDNDFSGFPFIHPGTGVVHRNF